MYKKTIVAILMLSLDKLKEDGTVIAIIIIIVFFFLNMLMCFLLLILSWAADTEIER